MASPLTQRALSRIADSGFARAKKLADLALKTNVNDAGAPTARGYEEAIGLLQPFIYSGKESEAIDAQRVVAGYNNSLTKLSKKQRDQNETVSAFKLQEQDAYFTSFDGDVGGFRDPSALVDVTSESLDNLVLGVINAIDEKEANGESTDALHSYLNDLTGRADTMRDLRSKFERGELGEGQMLDGFGYYVDTNPLDGSIRGAALLPVGLVPSDLTSGYRRLEATTKVGGALLPVYAPAQRNQYGEYTARVGDATWAGTGDGALRGDKANSSKILFKEGEFNIKDNAKFPIKTSRIDKGQFGVGLAGRDAEGNPVEGIFYRGNDNKLYSVDNNMIEQFKNDPVLNQKLNGYVARFSPSEMKELSREAVPFDSSKIGLESRVTGSQNEAQQFQAEADRIKNLGFFSKIKEGFSTMTEQSRANREETPVKDPLAEPFKSSFFGAKNRPNQPEEAPTGGSAPDIIESGRQFFQKMGDSFGVKVQ